MRRMTLVRMGMIRLVMMRRMMKMLGRMMGRMMEWMMERGW